MAQLPTQPWEADGKSDAPDPLDTKWGSTVQDIESTFSNISNTLRKIKLAKERSGLAILNIESSTASTQQNDKEMFLLLQATRHRLFKMEAQFRDMQNKPLSITSKDVTDWRNDAATARQTLDKVLSVLCYETDLTTDQLLPTPTMKEEKSREVNEWLSVEGDTDNQRSEGEDSVHQGVKL